jgi:hypothetical protein
MDPSVVKRVERIQALYRGYRDRSLLHEAQYCFDQIDEDINSRCNINGTSTKWRAPLALIHTR